MFWLKGCPRCGGDLYRDEDIYGEHVTCLQCGRHLNVVEAVVPGKAEAAPDRAAVGPRKERQRVA